MFFHGFVPSAGMRSVTWRAASVLAMLLLARAGAHGQQPADWESGLRFGTFSIAAVDSETGEVGVAVASRVACVGNVVPHVRVGVGAVATQALTRVEYGDELLNALAAGAEPAAALKQALAADAERPRRQVAVIAADGRSAQHTGQNAMAWAGQRAGRDYVAQGNILMGPAVLQAVATAFERSDGSGRPLADRLIEALAAGEQAGGDARRGALESAAVVVADPRRGRSGRPDRVTVEINLCEHEHPVAELRRVYESVSGNLGFRKLQQFYGTDVIQLKMLLHELGFFRAGEVQFRMDLTTPFLNQEVVDAVNAFRAAHRMAGPGDGSPPGLVDLETIELMWRELEKKGLADDVRRRIRDMTRL
jgi:uncharacterized Ntn-hydrolase superfamily protein